MTANDIKKLLLFTGGIMGSQYIWTTWIEKGPGGKGFVQPKQGFGVDDILHSLALAAGGFIVIKFVK